MPANNKYTIKYSNIVRDKGARIKLKIARPTHTSTSSVGDLTTAAKNTIVKLVDNSNNRINNLLHDEDIDKFAQSHIKAQAK